MKEAWIVNHEPMNKNQIEGVADQGERSRNREAFVVKDQAAYIWRLCDEGVRSYLGRSRLLGESPTAMPEREVSRGRSSWGRGRSGQKPPRRFTNIDDVTQNCVSTMSCTSQLYPLKTKTQR